MMREQRRGFAPSLYRNEGRGMWTNSKAVTQGGKVAIVP